MNYFTPEWHSGEIEDEDNIVYKRYKAHLAPLLPKWLPDVQTLAARINLHDGLIRECSWKPDEAELFLRLRCGDLRVGYFDLDLHYSGVLLSPLEWGTLLLLSANKNSSALYDEVDKENGRFVHRILFLLSRWGRSPRRINAYRHIKLPLRRAKREFYYREITIRFERLHLVTTPRECRFDKCG
jgi:hypothetical protein